MIDIDIIDEQNIVKINDDINLMLYELLSITLAYEDVDIKEGELSITFTDNANIRELNKKFRNIDKSTDVLSFPMYNDKNEINNSLDEFISIGDIVISMEKIISQAKEYNHSFEREITYIYVHSLLHLLGYDHIKEEDKIIMRSKEEEILRIYNDKLSPI